jgi:hypothetical protein
MKKTLAIIATFFCCLLSFFLEAAVDEDAKFPIRIQIENYGLYQLLGKNEQSFSPGSTAGYGSVINTRFIEQVKTITLKKNEVFGFKYSINDTSTEDEWVPVVVHIKHPQTTNYLGQVSYGFSEKSAAKLKSDGRYHNGAFYIFTEEYEMIPGEWTVSVIYRNEFVVRKRFNVIEN